MVITSSPLPLPPPTHTQRVRGKGQVFNIKTMIDGICASKKKNLRALTCLTVPTSLLILITQVKTLLYIVGQKARELSDASMSTCDGVRHIPGHGKINKTLALLLLIGGCSTCADLEGAGGPDPPPLENHKNIGFSNLLVSIPLKS